MPASYDAEVAELFRDLRAASNLSENDLAVALATRVDVVQALEQGALYALPPWTETCRVINAYGALLNLDVRPLLRRIYAQVEAGIVELQPKSAHDLPVMTRSDAVDFEFPEGPDSFDPHAPSSAPEPPAWPEPQPLMPDRREQPRAPQGQGRPPQLQPGQGQPGQTYSPQHPQGRPMPPPQYPGQHYPPSPPQGPQYKQTHPGQHYAPLGQPQPPQHVPPQQPQPPRPQAQEPFAPYANGPRPLATPSLPVEAETPPVPTVGPADKAPPRKGLLKWGLVALIVSAAIFTLWLTLGDSGPPRPTPSGSQSPESSDRVLDPDDPRSRKADRLPSPF